MLFQNVMFYWRSNQTTQHYKSKLAPPQQATYEKLLICVGYHITSDNPI